MLAAAQRRARAQGHHERPLPPDGHERPARPARGEPRRRARAAGRYMLAQRPARRRCGRRGGSSSRTASVALAAWAGPGREPVERRAGADPAERADLIEPHPPGPGQFAWADPNEIQETMEAAGFVEPEIDAVDFTIHYDDVDDWWVAQTQMSTAHRRRRQARWTSPPAATSWPSWSSAAEPFLQPDDSLEHPRPHVGRGRDRLRSPRHVLRRRRGSGPAARARPWPSWATAPRATPTPATSRTPG